MTITDEMTVGQAKAEMRKNLTEGCKCICGRHTQMYSRNITSAMAYALILIYNKFKQNNWIQIEYLHLENFFKEINDLPSSVRGDCPKLRFWNLIQPDGADNEDGNPNSGMYKITEQGKQFVEGKILVPSHINIYNNKMYGFNINAKDINIKQALKDKFNYDLLMGREVIA